MQELAQFIELYFELAARRMIPNPLGGTEPSPAVLQEFATNITKATTALARLSSFDSFAYGDRFTLADVAAILNLPVVRSGKRFREDPLATRPDAYCERTEQRPYVQTIRADAAADQGLYGASERMYGIDCR